jgi:hypothetical protein
MLQGSGYIVEQIQNGASVAAIEQNLHLNISLLHFAMLNDEDPVCNALFAGNVDFNEPNALGETIVHHAAQMGRMKPILQVIEWAKAGRVEFSAKTAIHSNFFHFVSSIIDKDFIATLLTMATPELLLDKNRLGHSPLSLIIQADNAIFLQAVLLCFPQLTALDQGWSCLKMHYDTLLHDIARFGAEKCFKVVRSRFSEKEWAELNHHRNQEDALPVEVALLSKQPKIFQMFKNYRNDAGIPTLEWTCAMQTAKNNVRPINMPHQEILDDAKDVIDLNDQDPFSDADLPDEGFGVYVSHISPIK